MFYQRTTIKDIARTVGVSPQTVSRVLNKRPDVASKTRQRVEQAIADLNYQPSAVARSLVHRRSYTLGIVTAGLNYIGPSLVLHGVITQAEHDGYTLLLKELPLEDIAVKPVLDALHASQVDGILWAVPEIDQNQVWIQEHVAHSPIPILFLGTQSQPGLSVVSLDNCMGGWLATEHLLAQGCRQIGHISGPLGWWGARERRRGWQESLGAAGITVADRDWAEGNWSSKSGAAAMHQLLKTYPEMDAVFVANDHMALGALQVAHQHGLHVPRDLAMVGFDNIAEAPYLWPPLTSIQQDWRKLGATAVEELIRMIQAGEQGAVAVEPAQVMFPPTLVIRESSQKVR